MKQAIRTAARYLGDRASAWRGRLDSRFSGRAQRAAKGKRILVSGATGGIGEAVASELVRCGAMVLVHGRSFERIHATLERLSAQVRHGAEVTCYQADLSDPAEIDRLIQEVRRDHPHLDGLINNAAVGHLRDRRIDSRGVEWAWAVNVLAPWHLAQGLAPALARAPAPRVVNVVSSLTQELDDDLMLECAYDPVHAYARSKQALIVLSVALAEDLRSQGIAVIAVDPGTIDTRMAAGFALTAPGLPPRHAGRLLARMIADPALSRPGGLLYRDGRRIGLPRQAQDEALRRGLVGVVQRQVRTHGNSHEFTPGRMGST